MVNSSTPVTTNKNYKKPGDPSLNSPGFSFNRINDALDSIDTDVNTLETDLNTAETDITTLENDLSTEETARADADKTGEFTKEFDTATFDGQGRLTGFVEGNKTVSNITYNGSSGKLESWREAIVLSGGTETRDYTATYSGDDLTDISYSVV